MGFVVVVAISCDEKLIRNVEHATYTVTVGNFGDDDTLPMNVTYTCDEGYSLRDPDSFIVGCVLPGITQGDGEHSTAEAQWRSFDAVECDNGEMALRLNYNHNMNSIYH